MTIRDRGSIKWTSMMLPEHVKELRKYINEDYYNVQEPVPDEQQLEEINSLILEAMELNIFLSFTIYKDKRLKEVSGHIHYIDHVKQEFKIYDKDNHLNVLKITSIKDVNKYT
ncbi:YolD-like family protein [Metabacillus indicus]|uniref:YolD-like family protein n=1 Tax=Metabacillus indicus TaxID=246786 RepID=UPI003CF21A8E